MADYTVAVDPGNGLINSVMALGNGKVKQYACPSFRATTDGKTLALPNGISVMQYEYEEWNGSKYVMGDTALRLGSDDIETHRGKTRYGSEFHAHLIASALAHLGVKGGTVDLTVFCPPGMYAEVQADIKKYLMETPVEIRLSGDKKARTWTYENVTIYPEGTGAPACILLDENGELVKTDVMAGNMTVLDGGSQTFDVLEFINGNLNPNALKNATYANQGLIKHVLDPILKRYQPAYPYLTLGHVEMAIRHGLETKDEQWILDPNNAARDIKPQAQSLAEKYAGWVGNHIIDGDFNGLASARSVIMIGGWAHPELCGKHIMKWYGDKILDTKKVPHLKKISPVDYNAIGGLRLALARMKKQGKALANPELE